MRRGTIDSLDEGWAKIALDRGGMCTVPASILPDGAREGDRLELSLRLLPDETRRAREAQTRKRESLRAENDEGDIEI